MNGIDTTALAGFAAAVTADPKAGEAHFAVTTHWQGGSRSRAHVSSYHLGGQEHPRQFVIDADEPPACSATTPPRTRRNCCWSASTPA